MKSLFAAIFFAFITINLSAQTEQEKPAYPVSEITKLITYTDVVQVDGKTKTQLYDKAMKWFHDYFPNPTDVIREQSKEKAKIEGKARFKIYTPEDKKTGKADMGAVQYTITFEAREGRYKVELTEFNWKQLSYYPIEKWMDKQDAAYKPNYDHYLLQTDEYAKQVIADLEKAMKTEPPVDNRDKW